MFLRRLPNLGDNLRELSTLFKTFKEKTRAVSKTFLFWEQYIEMVDILLQFIKAERSGNWDLYLSALAEMTPHFFAMDRPNYARWLPVYIADMNMLESSHPKVHEEFLVRNFSVSRSGHPFSQVSTDIPGRCNFMAHKHALSDNCTDSRS